MAKIKRTYECQACGARSPKWLGRCPDCSGWNTLTEIVEKGSFGGNKPRSSRPSRPVPLPDVVGGREPRFPSGYDELDRVLGGGVVEGSAVLVGGDPGIGKSTLLLQLMMAQAGTGKKVLYVSGEESARQIRMRADRLGEVSNNLLVLAETDLDAILSTMDADAFEGAVIDSVQTVASADIGSAPGTVSQVRESAGRLVGWAKAKGVPLFLVGHVTKDGAIAGPRVLEHMVDTVLYFEGDKGLPFRILRSVKNRFGSTNEVGVFEMGDGGLAGVPNPSALFLSERPENGSGSAVVPCVEGTRTLLVEVQALVSPQNFATAQRTTSGVERNRVQILAALLERRLGVPMLSHDIFINVAGGLQASEPACDLAVVAALVSSFYDKPLPWNAVFFGEVGLSGEVRGVSQTSERIGEAARLGFSRVFAPASAAKGLEKGAEKVDFEPVGDLDKLLDRLGF